MAQTKNTVKLRIDGRIQGLPPEPSWPKIFQVPHYFRKLNEKAYEPKIISIGPCHRQKAYLKAMETHKVRFLKDLLQQRDENSAERYVEVMTGMMEKARSYYAESLVISDEEFLEMMVLDGCFIVELIHKMVNRSWQQDSILNVSQIRNNIWKDLRLVENQLPLFVLWDLFGKMNEDPSPYILIILKMSEEVMPGLRVCETYNENSMKNLKHLIDLFRTNWLPSEDSMREYQKVQEDGGWSFIRYATELREAGIKFKRSKGSNLFDIKFENGTLYIPTVTIDDDTERLFRNIITCEQFDNSGSPKYLTDYLKVMDCPITTGKDVELLCHKGIIQNWLGTDEQVAKMINRLGIEVIISSKNFYAKLFNDVNIHYNRPWNKRMASLRHNYFKTPWALISFLVAAFLLILRCCKQNSQFSLRPKSAKNLFTWREQRGSADCI